MDLNADQELELTKDATTSKLRFDVKPKKV
jgi:hypothetical protein